MGAFFSCNQVALSPDYINVIWIDSKINNDENTKYQKDLKPLTKLNCFENIKEGIDFLKTIKFEKVVIIISGRISTSFYEELKNNLNEIIVIPKIIIFTRNSKKFIEENNKPGKFPIEHPFFNDGGVANNYYKVKEYVLSFKNNKSSSAKIKMCAYFAEINIDNENEEKLKKRERLKNEDIFNFEIISDKNQLILPLYFSSYLEIPKEEDIQIFNEFMLDAYGKSSQIKELFLLLKNVKEIPNEILSKFYVRAYTAESDFYKEMNLSLMKKDKNKYLTYIRMLYEGVKIKSLKSHNNSILYRGALMSKKELNNLKKFMLNKKKNLPSSIVYGRSFFSFSFKKEEAEKFYWDKTSKKNEELIPVFLILEGINENSFNGNASISEYSFYEAESEVLFFPFSCFEIKSIEENKDDKDCIITLNYLEKYEIHFKNKKTEDLLRDVPKTNYSFQAFSINIINPNLSFPDWVYNKKPKPKHFLNSVLAQNKKY